MAEDFEIVRAGDAALIVKFSERIDPSINARAVALASRLRDVAQPGIRDVVPAFRSVAVYFDPLQTDHVRLLDQLRQLASVRDGDSSPQKDPIQVPVKYGGLLGPDLGEVARFAGTSEDEVVRLHTGATYRVFMLGFVPGFAYMGTVDPRIAAPRRQTPRVSVPPGAVGIASGQTGIYPIETPGGWQLIGRTTVRPFNLARLEPCLFKPGDTVRFIAVDELP